MIAVEWRGRGAIVGALFFTLLIFALPTLGNLSGSTNYNLTLVAISNGGPSTSSTNYNASQVIGSIAGTTASAKFNASLGFFYGAGPSGEPTINYVDLTPSFPDTRDNLTCQPIGVSDANGDPVQNITNWALNGISRTVVLMPFEGGSGASVTPDYSSYDNDGTVSGPTWGQTSGLIGGGYQFDAVDDNIQIAFATSLNFTDALTVEFHFRPAFYITFNQTANTSLVNDSNISSQMFLDTYNSSSQEGFELFMEQNGTLMFRAGNGTHSETYNRTHGNWTVGAWYHLAIVLNTTNRSLKWFENGTHVQTDTFGLVALAPGGLPLTIGANESGTGQEFNGTMDELRIYNLSLSSHEIFKHNQTRYDTIHANETTRDQSWACTVTPNDGYSDGDAKSDTETINNSDPIIGSVNITPDNPNFIENLTCDAFGVQDADGDPVQNITNWFRQNISRTVLLMPFEGGSNATFTRDYSPYGNAGNITNSSGWNRSGGILGGAYLFEAGNSEYVRITDDSSINTTNQMTVSFWIRPTNNGSVPIGKYDFGNAQRSWRFWISGTTNRVEFRISSDGSQSIAVTSTTSLLTDGTTWYHIAGIYNGTNLGIFVDGVEETNVANDSGIFASSTDIAIGTNFNSGALSNTYNGSIDEVRIYNTSLSPAQILLHNATRYNVIHANETADNESWTCLMTPNDGYFNGAPINETEDISNAAPTAPLLNYPLDNDTAFINRTPRFNWSASSDGDGDDLTYTIEISNAEDFSTTVLNVSGIATTYFDHNSTLAFDTFWWRAKAYDALAYSNYSIIFNFTVVSSVSITLLNASVDFGSLGIGVSDSTDDGSPYPIVIENDGNVEANISINATPLWSSVALNLSNYQARANNSAETGTFVSAETTYLNLSTELKGIVYWLNWTNTNDTVSIDINVTVPIAETPEIKNSTLLIRAVEAG